MKKILILIHAAIILVILIVLGNITSKEDSVPQKFDGNLEQNVTLKILENNTAIKQGYLAELLKAFNEKYKEYGIVAVDANMDEASDLVKDGPYGFGPDVLYQANDTLMKYVDGKHILPLPEDKIESLSNFDDKALGAFSKDISGQKMLFGVPVNIQGPLLYYRKDLLPSNWKTAWDDNHNNIPDMLESWNKMYEYSKMLKNDDDPKTFGYMRSFLEPYFSSGYLFSYGAYVFGDNNTNPKDIGFEAGEAYKGLSVIKQLATVMDKRCLDDTITTTAYSKLAKGEFFATVTTPDVYSMFVDQLKVQYGNDINVDDYLGVADIPKLPKSGNLDEKNPELIPCKMMGGINGYSISSYTKYPNDSLAFVNFATSYEMLQKRNDLLGIVPAREDLAQAIGGLSEVINNNLADGNIEVMPSISEVGQIWKPLQSMFQDVAGDAFRSSSDVKFKSDDDYKNALSSVDETIYRAIFNLQG